MSITVNIYYKGRNGSAIQFAKEMETAGIAEAIRNKAGNLGYRYFLALDDPETVLLIDSWESEKALEKHHHSWMMDRIAELREKYDITMKVERYKDDTGGVPKADEIYIRKKSSSGPDAAERTEVFRDTVSYYSEDPILKAAVEWTEKNTGFYAADDYPELPFNVERSGRVTVTKNRTFEAAMRLSGEDPGKRIAVLNFASATNPGGGVLHGSSAQEESLCRCSTLYAALDTKDLWDRYYGPNRKAQNVLNTDACIYTPDIVICKTDEALPRRLPPRDFLSVDVITCAAPNLREHPYNKYNTQKGEPAKVTAKELFDLHVKRAEHIMHIAAVNRVDILVLGAFGCGAFRNDPHVVAEAYREALKRYAKMFDTVEFAIYCGDHGTQNYDAFRETLIN